jgi:cytochrome c553
MSTPRFLLLVSSFCWFAAAPFGYADRIKEGQALATAVDYYYCHGKAGNSFTVTEPITPIIAGQSLEYLRKAMLDYKSEARSGTIISRIMSVRTDDEIELLAEYYSAQKHFETK